MINGNFSGSMLQPNVELAINKHTCITDDDSIRDISLPTMLDNPQLLNAVNGP